MEIYVASEQYVAGRDEEGRDYVAEGYYVVAELEGGTRYRQGWFPGCEMVKLEDECGCWVDFRDVRKEALAQAEALAASSQESDVSDWASAVARYGSPAFEESSLYDDEERARYGY